ncbi:MAG: hypothetical protein HY560_13095 [Gemmatimonadetes bacterium]|nr:hypothetical protein [Gemmatimonadota bacterium]
MQWPEIVTALSTLAIAILLALPAVASFLLFRELRRAVSALERFGVVLEQDVVPAVHSARDVIEQASQVAATVRTEVEGMAETSRDLRARVRRAADATEERLADLETLLDLLYDEVEDTALDVAAALRTTRRGASMFSAVKRALFKGRR